jgi:chemotaxis protein methyltransferase CheR
MCFPPASRTDFTHYRSLRICTRAAATGEEGVFYGDSLRRRRIIHRCRIYATDMNEMVLKQAKIGVYSMKSMQEYTQNYLQAGGKQSFSQYYTAAYEHAMIRSSLKENIIFSQHNLAIDGSFNEFNVILCRNVLIYFNQSLQERVHKLLYESISRFGILGLGRQESLKFTPHEQQYEALDKREKLYRRIG